tara:strand:- start:121 stop:432 length:312 start_codon:yes stop_codon:yes gene_type:complete
MKIRLTFLILINFFILSYSFSDEKFDLGKNIFLNAGNCSACHSLADAGSVANVGPNLDEIKPDIGRVIISVTNGAGVMPSYLGILSQDEIEAVAYYVSEASMK